MALAGKVCIVTGASRGIGKGIALQLGEAGATVYITGRTLSPVPNDPIGGSLLETAKEITLRGGKCVPVQCDHSKDEDIRRLFDKVNAEKSGRLDILVNNAYSGVKVIGENLGKKFWTQPLSVWDTINNVGLRNHYMCAVHAAQMMVPRKQGLIVNISSMGGLIYILNIPYGIGKEACDRMAADCSKELKEHNVTFVSIWPDLVKTEALGYFMKTGVWSTDGLNEKNIQMENAYNRGETIEYSGRAIVHLAKDPNVIKKTGKVLMTGELGAKYGFTDIDGCNSSNVDIVFLLDNSDLVVKSDFLKELDFVKNVIKTYTIGTNDTQVGLVTFSDVAKTEFSLSVFTNKTALLEAVNSTEYGTNNISTINVEAALNYVYTNSFKVFNGGRANAVDFLVLLTSGGINNSRQIKEKSEKLRNSGVAIYVIGLSSSLSYNDLAIITSDRGNVFRLNSFDGLRTFLPLITDKVCTVITQHKTEMKLLTLNPEMLQDLTTSEIESKSPELPLQTLSLLTTGESPTPETITDQKGEHKNDSEIRADDFERPHWLFYLEILILPVVSIILIGELICVGRSVWISLKKKSHKKWKKENSISHNKRRVV